MFLDAATYSILEFSTAFKLFLEFFTAFKLFLEFSTAFKLFLGFSPAFELFHDLRTSPPAFLMFFWTLSAQIQ